MNIVGGARKLHSLAVAVHSKISSFTTEQFNITYHHYLTWTGLPTVSCHYYGDELIISLGIWGLLSATGDQWNNSSTHMLPAGSRCPWESLRQCEWSLLTIYGNIECRCTLALVIDANIQYSSVYIVVLLFAVVSDVIRWWETTGYYQLCDSVFTARQCPSLLRDLLMTTELHQCLGAEIVGEWSCDPLI